MAMDEQLLDRLRIRELLENYCDAVNQRDGSAWGRTWSTEAVWELPHLDIDIRGRDAIVTAWEDAMKLFPFVNMMAQPGPIEFSGERATMRSYTMEVAVTQEGKEIRPCGEYDDECIKEDGQWVFSRRTFRVLHGE